MSTCLTASDFHSFFSWTPIFDLRWNRQPGNKEILPIRDTYGNYSSDWSSMILLLSDSVRRLWLIVALLCSLTTMFLSLDTTAVLLTPVVLVMASGIGISPWPFALTTVWLANTASLLLPVSNLANLLLVNRLHWSALHYATRMWFPALVAIVITLFILIGFLGKSLTGHYSKVTILSLRDPLLFRLSLIGHSSLAATL